MKTTSSHTEKLACMLNVKCGKNTSMLKLKKMMMLYHLSSNRDISSSMY